MAKKIKLIVLKLDGPGMTLAEMLELIRALSQPQASAQTPAEDCRGI